VDDSFALANDFSAVAPFEPSPHQTQLGRGVHEVIIESSRHLHSNTEQSLAELTEVLWVYRERLRALASSGQWRYGLIFKNVGFAAGASLEHLHSQVVALPIVPSAIEETLRATAIFHKERRDCYFCDLVRREISEGMRVVAETAHFAAICPFASRFAFETWIIPKRHAAAFSAADEDELSDLAGMLSNVLRKLELGLDKPAYNYAIRTAPFDRHTAEHYHWHIEIFPRVTRLAGFELSTDFYINVVRPEDAAALLRRT
jgi:UDPglucose--hexose-1-phosphate uridylyltransferase